MDNIANKLKALGDAAEAIKRIEGETKDSNFDWSLLFPEKKKLHIGWLISSIIFFAAICVGAILLGTNDQQSYIIIFTAGILATIWVTSCAQLRFENTPLSGAIFFSLFIAFLVASRVLTPSEGAGKMLDRVDPGSDRGSASQ